jgi:hypothetical protein
LARWPAGLIASPPGVDAGGSRLLECLRRGSRRDHRGLLTDIYLEIRRSLEIENQGGARITVKPVDGAWKRTALELLQEERL